MSQSSTLVYSRKASSRARPLMLMTISAASQASRKTGLEPSPSTGYPFLSRVFMVISATKPRGVNPARDASITSAALRRAMASAMGLRQEFPRQTNNTRIISQLYADCQDLSATFVCHLRFQAGDHLPRTLPCHLHKTLVHGRVIGQLGMKRGSHDALFLHKRRLTCVLREHFDARAYALDDRRANEHHFQIFFFQRGRPARHFACDLSPIGIAQDGHIQQTQRVLRGIFHLGRKKNRSGARA